MTLKTQREVAAELGVPEAEVGSLAARKTGGGDYIGECALGCVGLAGIGGGV